MAIVLTFFFKVSTAVWWQLMATFCTLQMFTGSYYDCRKNLDPYSGTCMYCNCLLMTCTRELRPVLGNMDPYSGTLNLTRTRLCTKVPEYNTLKKKPHILYFFDNTAIPALQDRISTQGNPCSHYREWVCRVQFFSVLVTFFHCFINIQSVALILNVICIGSCQIILQGLKGCFNTL